MERDEIAEADDAADNSAAAFPARLHVILAREAPVGIVLRRGPSKRVCTLHWNLKDDTFTLGQWLKGRIYERRSDLSPDGRHFLYFAMNGKWHQESLGSWTAISRTPYLTAITFYPKGDCWNGGGLFTTNRTYWLNGAHATDYEDTTLRQDTAFQLMEHFGSECTGVYYPRLIRDGWICRAPVEFSQPGASDFQDHSASIFDRPIGYGWTLRKIAHEQVGAPEGKGCYWDEHELRHPASGRIEARPGWEWAELSAGRLLWAEAGCLYAATMGPHGPTSSVKLADFNGMAFRRVVASYGSLSSKRRQNRRS